jgi:hypothetical protein
MRLPRSMGCLKTKPSELIGPECRSLAPQR